LSEPQMLNSSASKSLNMQRTRGTLLDLGVYFRSLEWVCGSWPPEGCGTAGAEVVGAPRRCCGGSVRTATTAHTAATLTRPAAEAHTGPPRRGLRPVRETARVASHASHPAHPTHPAHTAHTALGAARLQR
jgi:hypothetical protein